MLYIASFGLPVFLMNWRWPARSLAFEIMSDGCQFPEVVALVIPFAALINVFPLAGAACLSARCWIAAVVFGSLAGLGGWALTYFILEDAAEEHQGIAYGPGFYLWFSCIALLLVGVVVAHKPKRRRKDA
jgi:hypothetical protein